MEKSYYLYDLVNPLNNLIFYSGVTKDPKRRLQQHCNINKNAFKTNPYKTLIIKEIKKAGFLPEMKIIFGPRTKEEIEKLEVIRIAELKEQGVKLTNISPGGDIISTESVRKANETKIGKLSYDKLTNYAWLYNEYINLRKTSYKIAEELNVDCSTVLNLLEKHDICIRKNSESKINSEAYNKLSDYDWLYNEYIVCKKSSKQISDMIKISSRTVYRFLEKHNIQTRSLSQATLGTDVFEKLSNYNWIHNEYVILRKSANKISKELSISTEPVFRALKKHNINIKNRTEVKIGTETYKKLTNYAWLYNEYVVLEKTSNEIAEKLGISRNAVLRSLKKHNIGIKRIRKQKYKIKKEGKDDIKL